MALFFLGLVIVGIVEIASIVALNSVLHWMLTLLLLILISATGAWVVKRQGTATWRRVASGVRAGHVPTADVLDGGLIVVAGFLLLLPGFVSDLVAVALLVPPSRALIRRAAGTALQRRITRRVARVQTTTFGFGFDPAAGFGAGTFGGDRFATGSRATTDPFGPAARRRDDDIIDLEGEEFYVDEPIAEIEPRDRRAGGAA